MDNMDFKVNANDKSTKKYLLEIEKYMKSNVLNNNKFICCHKSECKKSYSGDFFEGQSYHIGKYYDLKINKKPFRVMVVGQELGHRERKLTLKDRYIEMGSPEEENWTFNGRNGDKGRNPHMKGTTSVLRLLFGKNLGVDYESEFLDMTNKKKCHIFDAFAFVNYLLCSALKEGKGMAGKSTRTMKNNCFEHFSNTVRILKPNVIIVQGKVIWEWIKDSFDEIKHYPGSEIIYQAKVNNSSAIVAFFTHPSVRNEDNWGNNDHTKYLLETVKPTVKRIQKIIGII